MDTVIETEADPKASGALLENPALGRDIVGIQYLRGVAAMMVVVYHASLQIKGLNGDMTLEAFALGAGVDIFFVISGFVMFVSTDAGRLSTPKNFLRKRIARIVPLYWAATLGMIFILVSAPQLVKSSKLTWDHALASLAFVAYENPAVSDLYAPLVAPGWTLNLGTYISA